MNNGFQLVSDEGDEWLERRVTVANQLISVQLLPEEKAFQTSLPYAEAILNDIGRIISSLHDFVSNEKEKFPTYQEDFDQLKNATIAFVSTTEPDVAEITFPETASGRIWGCAYKNDRFFNLGFDD